MCSTLKGKYLPDVDGGLLNWNFKQIFVALFIIFSFRIFPSNPGEFSNFSAKPEGEFGEAGGPKTCGNSDLTNSSGIESPGKLSSFSVVDSCKYCGSNIQNPPFPGSSLVLLIFLKHLFNDKLWRMEFCKNKERY